MPFGAFPRLSRRSVPGLSCEPLIRADVAVRNFQEFPPDGLLKVRPAQVQLLGEGDRLTPAKYDFNSRESVWNGRPVLDRLRAELRLHLLHELAERRSIEVQILERPSPVAAAKRGRWEFLSRLPQNVLHPETYSTAPVSVPCPQFPVPCSSHASWAVGTCGWGTRSVRAMPARMSRAPLAGRERRGVRR